MNTEYSPCVLQTKLSNLEATKVQATDRWRFARSAVGASVGRSGLQVQFTPAILYSVISITSTCARGGL